VGAVVVPGSSVISEPSTRSYARDVADVDEPRFLAPVAGYVRESARAVDQLEAVSAVYQRELSQRARLDELRRTRQAWATTEVTVEAAIAGFEKVADPRLRPGLRALRKARRRVARAVEALEPIDE
jgi:hypothetical protein